MEILCIHDGANLFLGGLSGGVKQISTTSQQVVKVFPGCLKDKISSICITTNNFMFVASKTELKQISIISGEIVRDYDHGSNWIFCLKLRDLDGKESDDETLFSTCSEGKIRRISVNDQKILKVEDLGVGVDAMVISSDKTNFYWVDVEGVLKQIKVEDAAELVCSYGKVSSGGESCIAI